jgi:hypothetical protein
MRMIDRSLLGELNGASGGISVAPVAPKRKVTPLAEIRFDSVGGCEVVMPAQGSCHRSFVGLDVGFYQDS